MNDMTPIATPLQRFSAGEISRVEFGRLIQTDVSFGDVLMMLHDAQLPLPRYGRPFNPEGINLLREALCVAKRG
jgi:hypothetical protein